MKKQEKVEKAKNKIPEKSRRSILRIIWMGLGIVAFMEIVGVCLTFFKPARKQKAKKNTDNISDVGRTDEYEPGSVTPFVRGRFYLVHLNAGGFLAISSKCTHLGCTVPWNKKINRFVCPCHSSEFDITGKVLSSPAPRAMDLYKIEITNNRIFVDTDQRIQRKGFSQDQIAYPDTIKTKVP